MKREKLAILLIVFLLISVKSFSYNMSNSVCIESKNNILSNKNFSKTLISTKSYFLFNSIKLFNRQIKSKNIFIISFHFLILLVLVKLFFDLRKKNIYDYYISDKNKFGNIYKELEKLSIVANKTSNAIIIFDRFGNIEWFNNAYEHLYGYPFNEYIKNKGSNIFDISNSSKIREYVTKCLKTKQNVTYETRITNKNKNIVYIQTTLSPIINKNKYIEKLVAIDLDITNIKNIKRESLQNNEELEKLQTQIEKLVEERTKELVMAKNKAIESDKIKYAFLANMTHEIRTPMNAIIGFSKLLQDRKLSINERIYITNSIISNSNILIRLINDLLDLAQIESGQFKVNKEECSINEIFNSVLDVAEMSKALKKKDHIEIIYKQNYFKADLIYTDPLRLKQVLLSLIENGIKFTEKGFIEYGCRINKNNQLIEIFVKDTGIGIVPEKLKLIFSRFYKIEDKNNFNRGTGLGLSICKNIIKLLGGNISVNSIAGKGSTFHITLPLNHISELQFENNKSDDSTLIYED